MSADAGTDAPDRYPVGSVAELSAHPRVVEVDGETFLLHAGEDGVVAYRNVCPHQGGPVAEGRVDTEDGTVVCPWHGWAFDLDSGENRFGTDVGARLPEAETVVEDGQVYLRV